MIGIYKITNPKNKIYIGQAINIDKRKNQYMNYKSYTNSIGPKIYNSLLKYGWEQHRFEIIEECSLEQLDERETYFKIYYLEQVEGKWGKVLFCGLYDNGGGPKTKETKLKMSNSQYINLTKPEILSKRLINCKLASTKESNNKKVLNTNWVERNKKLKKDKKFYKLIIQYDLKENFIREWNNIRDIMFEFDNSRPQNLYTCLRGEYKTWKGYKWVGILN